MIGCCLSVMWDIDDKNKFTNNYKQVDILFNAHGTFLE